MALSLFGGRDATSGLVTGATGKIAGVDAENEFAFIAGRKLRLNGGNLLVGVSLLSFEGLPFLEGTLHTGEDIFGVSGGSKFAFEVFGIGADHVNALFGAGMVPVATGHIFAVGFEKDVRGFVFDTIQVARIFGIEKIHLISDGDKLCA